MGQCYTIPLRDIPTHVTKLNIDNSAITFEIPQAQTNAEGIRAIIIILLDPENTFYQYVNQTYAGRKICIDMVRFIEQQNINIRKESKIEFRLAYLYRNYRCLPTSVMPMIYNPGEKLHINMRLSLQAIQYKNMQEIEFLNNYKHPQASYYKVSPTCLNILLLGSRALGKSSYIKQISQLLIEKYHYLPRIGNHHDLNITTTTSFDEYPIIKNSNSSIKLIDSPGYTIQELMNFSSNYQYFQKGIPSTQTSILFEHKNAMRGYIEGKRRSNKDPENYENVIHSAIVFIDPNSKQSLKVAEEFIKILVAEKVQYIICVTRWEQENTVMEDIFVEKIDKKKLKEIYEGSKLCPMPQRFFLISNIKAANENQYAINVLLESFKCAIQLAGNFYIQFPPVHIALDYKVIEIRHRVNLGMTLAEFMAMVNISQLLEDNRRIKNQNSQEKLITMLAKHAITEATSDVNYFEGLYLQTYYGRKSDRKKGFILFDTLIQREMSGTKLQNFITIVDEKYRIFNMVSKLPFFAHKIT